jgi:hypothetical protein
MTRLAMAALMVAAFVGFGAQDAKAQDAPLPRAFYYPYQYFPHNYWPSMSPQYPEAKGSPYMKPMKYYRGHHFWLDQF